MTPIFTITGDGNDITSQVSDRLIEISVCDNAGFKNDSLAIVVDDGPDLDGASMIFPPSGTKYVVLLGYEQADNQEVPCPLTPVGVFTQDGISCEKDDGGRRIHITAHAADHEGTLKQIRTRSYHNTKLGDIVDECAQRNKLEAVIEKEFGDIEVDHIDQTNESDGSFLTRLYDDYGAIAKPYRGKLFFGSPESVRTMMGESSGTVPIHEESCSQWKFSFQGRSRFTGTRARYYDKDKGEDKEEESDRSETREETYYTSPHTHHNKGSAKRAANAKKRAFRKQECSFDFTVIGNPQLVAGGKVTLIDFRQDIPTVWQLSRVDHRFSKSGFITNCCCETKARKSKSGEGGGDGSEDDDRDMDYVRPPDEPDELPAPDLPELGSEDAGDATNEGGDPNDDPMTILKRVFG